MNRIVSKETMAAAANVFGNGGVGDPKALPRR